MQQGVDAIYQGKTTGNWSFFGGGSDSFNIVKFMLGGITIFFDFIFMFQHYYLYPEDSGIDSTPFLSDADLISTPPQSYNANVLDLSPKSQRIASV